MLFGADNPIVRLCARGMECGAEEALAIFHQAWDEAQNDLEKCVAAHYIAGHQKSIGDKLAWDQTSLEHALKVKDEGIRGAYPSLYLNIGKCLEDLGDPLRAHETYRLAFSYTAYLSADGYGNMIKAGIQRGIERTSGAGNTFPARNEY